MSRSDVLRVTSTLSSTTSGTVARASCALFPILKYISGYLARSTTTAVLVNGLTTMMGFGSLMLAAHRGIHGLGLLLTLGAASNLVAALVVLPVLLRRFGHGRGAARPAP